MFPRFSGGSFLLLYCLSAALAVFIAVLLVLAFTLYKLITKYCAVCKGKTFRIKVFNYNLLSLSIRLDDSCLDFQETFLICRVLQLLAPW